MKTKKTKKRIVTVTPTGRVHIQASYNNVIVSMTNDTGQVIAWSSSGKVGFKGAKKNTPYAAKLAAQNCTEIAYNYGLRSAHIFVKGVGLGREAAIRSVQEGGINVLSIQDVTPIPHNGCRPPKKRHL